MELKTISKTQAVSNLNEDGVLIGYASVFDNIDHHNDIIIKGAFRDSNIEKIKFLWQHDHKEPIGSIISLVEDNFGLKVEVALDLNVKKAREAFSLVKSNAISGLSIGFNPIDYDYNEDSIRVIKKIDLWEISLVTFPSNVQANVICAKNNFNSLKLLADTVMRAQNALIKLK